MAATLAQVATFATAVEPDLDLRFAAALCTVAAANLAARVDDTDMATPAKLLEFRRRAFALTIIKDPMGVAQSARWTLAAAPLPVLATYLASGAAGITDAALVSAARSLWDALAEA